MKVVFKTAKEMAAWVPPPLPASKMWPEWMKKLKREAEIHPADWPLGTPKKCPPFVDAMATGWLMRLPVAVRVVVSDLGVVSYSSNPGAAWRPIGSHFPEQTEGTPLDSPTARFVVPWGVEMPEGYSLLHTHPLNRYDLPFLTLSGVIDSDYTAPVNLPFVWTDWTPGEKYLDAGMPIAQLVPIKQDEWEHEIDMTAERAELYGTGAKALGNIEGYRNHFQVKKVYT